MAVKKKQTKPDSGLSTKHEMFIDLYLKNFNAVKSYMEVYPDSTYEAAGVSSHALLKNPKIITEINKRIDLLKERIPTDIIQHLKNLVFFNINDLLDEDGEVDPKKIKENAIPGIVSGISIQENNSEKGSSKRVAFKLTDQNKAIELMSKILKLYDDKPEVNVTIPPIQVQFPDK